MTTTTTTTTDEQKTRQTDGREQGEGSEAEGSEQGETALGFIDENTPIGRVFEFDPGGLEPFCGGGEAESG